MEIWVDRRAPFVPERILDDPHHNRLAIRQHPFDRNRFSGWRFRLMCFENIVDMEKRGSLKPDIHESRLHAGSTRTTRPR